MKRFGLSALVALSFFLTACGVIAGKDNGPSYAIILGKEDSHYYTQMEEGFKNTLEEAGKTCRVIRSESLTGEGQAAVIKNLVREGIDAVVISGTREQSVLNALKAAVENGVTVIAVDSDMPKESRSLYLLPASEEEIGASLVRSVYQVSGKEGQWALLTKETTGVSQEEWLFSLKSTLENPRYGSLRLVDMAYGEDQYDSYVSLAKELIWTHPDLKVICAATVTASKAAADVVSGYGMEDIKVTGLGDPKDMERYMTSQPALSPLLYIMDPRRLGEGAANVCMKLQSGEVKLERGALIEDGKGKRWEITEGKNGNLLLITGSLRKIDEGYFTNWN